MLEEAYPDALEEASYEAFEGKRTIQELNAMADKEAIVQQAMSLIDQ